MDLCEPLIGTAGWIIRSEHRDAFSSTGAHLERYATRLNAVEINSSFYRSHRRATYDRWANSVGSDFRFSVKLPKTISHAGLTASGEGQIELFASAVSGLGEKLGVVLIQFPPSLAFDASSAMEFFASIATRLSCRLACEPRHRSGFTGEGDAMLARLEIARVAAEPGIVFAAATPGGWLGLRYHRFHGSPDIYRSEYARAVIDEIRAMLATEAASGVESWCIFDNTSHGFATSNALDLRQALGKIGKRL